MYISNPNSCNPFLLPDNGGEKVKETIFGCVLFLSGSIAGIILFVTGFIHFLKWKVMRDTRTQKIADLIPGRVEVKGRITEVPGGLLHSPVTGTPCVGYEAIVSEIMIRGEKIYLKPIHKDKKEGIFFVTDGTGKILVDPWEVGIDQIQSVSSFQGPLIEMDPRALEYIQQVGIEDKGILGIARKRLVVQENVIPIDKEYYVLGIAEEIPRYEKFLKDQPTIPLTIKKKDTIFSLKSEREMLRSRMIAWILYFMGSGFFLLLGILGMIGAMNM